MKKTLRIIFKILSVICLIGIIYFSYKIITWKIQVDENHKIKDSISKNIKVKKKKVEEEEKVEYTVDFESLKKDNPDTIAYLKVNNTNIDYVVVKGNNNDYYLNHNFHKNSNIAGWIFADYRNTFDDQDENIVIYGHDTKDGSMFGTLKNILSKGWYENEENKIITLITESGTYSYEVFSVYTIIPEDYYITTNIPDEREYEIYLNTLKERSITDFHVELSTTDKILTLSSCIGNGEKRVVLHAKRIKEGE